MSRESTLQEALRCVTKDRQNSYGTPEQNFKRISGLWSMYLNKYISPVDVCNLMILLKIARTQSSPDYSDNWIDIAGYSACAEELSQEEEKEKCQESC